MRNEAAFASTAKKSPSLEDYTNFHGMLCSPMTAQRCIDSFDGGTVLFLPNTHCSNTIAKHDAAPVFSVLTYYLLVMFSLTGLSTLLKATKFRHAKEYSNQPPVTGPLASLSDRDLVVNESVCNFVKDQQRGETTMDDCLTLERQFEYEFLGGLSVVMFHLICQNNRLHLVEVYQIKNKVLGAVVAVFSETISIISRATLFVTSMRLKKRL
mmetsp:Transcript_26052/g.43465  ORF Transcript_26052/g.43465 Transcript_26052/m.43465 type:complete len:211 (+) Transcript_26052:43-675(+)